ncbi:MAG: HAMP domain-containing protein [Minwuiales bacterium]|nr:HAMP domain-containing protein [Minwuiales bacterium]
MTGLWRYHAYMAVPVALFLTADLIFAWVVATMSEVAVVLAIDFAVFGGTIIGGGHVLLFRPMVRAVEAGESTALTKRINGLPGRSAGWVALCIALLYPLVVSLQLLRPEAPDNPPLPLDFTLWITALFALTSGFLVYFLVADFVTQLKVRLFETKRLAVPAGGGRIRRKLVTVLAVTSLLPIAALAADIFYFSADRASGALMSVEQAVLVDVLMAAIILTVAIVFLPRGFARPIDVLLGTIDRVHAGDMTARAPITTDDEIGVLTNRFNEMIEGLNERNAIRETFGKYMPRTVAEQLVRDPGSLSGDVKLATIMFTDIENFTAITENIPPAEIIRLLNDYLGVVVEPIRRHNGVVNSFLGDALFASFNVPIEDPDHAANAIRAAEEMQALLKDRTFGGDGIRLDTRIGINTGVVVAGTVGTEDRLGYTILGDEVNLAARLESLNKDYGSKILISARTRELAGDGIDATELGQVTVRGRAQPVVVYKVGA